MISFFFLFPSPPFQKKKKNCFPLFLLCLIKFLRFVILIRVPAIFSPANLSTERYSTLLSEHPSGVYFGWAALPTRGVFKMVMSIGWNPYFNNTEKTIVSVWRHINPAFALMFLLVDKFNLQCRSHGSFMTLMWTFMGRNCILSQSATYGLRYKRTQLKYINLLE